MKELQSAQAYMQGAAPEGAVGPDGQPVDQKEAIPTKKVVTALLTALEHKLGREPTPEELADALQQKEDPAAEQAELEKQQETESLPKVLSYKIYYGMKQGPDGSRAPDPELPLYYENHDGSQWFDVEEGVWNTERPRMLDHLPSRCLGDSDNQKDVFDAIVYGVMDDDDYQKLSTQQGMLDPRCVRAYELHKKAKEQYEQLQMQSMEKSVVEDDFQPAEGEQPQQDNIKSMLSAAGIESSKPVVNEAFGEEPGAGGGPAMVEHAMGPGVEYRIRRLVQEEIAKSSDMLIARLLEMLESGDQPQVEGEEQVEPGQPLP